MVEPPTLGQVYVGETAVDVGSTPTPVTMTSNRGSIKYGTTSSMCRYEK